MKKLVALVTVVMALQTAMAESLTQSFSAFAVQQIPGSQPRLAKMYVTPDHVRKEFEKQGEVLIEITDLKSGRSFLLFPKRKRYMLREAPSEVTQQQGDSSLNPCKLQPLAQCRLLGTETLFGRPVEKWEMSVIHQGKTYISRYWIDQTRGVPLRQELADGTRTELRPVAEETLYGRPTEKWQMTTTLPDGKTRSSTEWYDKELKIVTREELPGGYVRELRDISVGPQDPSLFVVPPGYEEVAALSTNANPLPAAP